MPGKPAKDDIMDVEKKKKSVDDYADRLIKIKEEEKKLEREK